MSQHVVYLDEEFMSSFLCVSQDDVSQPPAMLPTDHNLKL